MQDALTTLDIAQKDAEKAIQVLARKTTKQVTSEEEIDRLKAVAFAWFQSHCPVVESHALKPDIREVRDAYQRVLSATGRATLRSTYKESLQAARKAIIEVRNQVAMAPATVAASPDTPPDFAPLAVDVGMREILVRRWNEVQHCIQAQAFLAATVMMGGLLETLIIARINRSTDRAAIYTAAAAPRDRVGKTLQLGDWKLTNMVNVAHELLWITKSAKDMGHVLRDFRNYIHPHKEHAEKVSLKAADAEILWEVAKSITRQVLSSVGNTP